jgi:hypothetical protein
MAGLSGVAAQGPGAAFPCGRLTAGGDTGEGDLAAGGAGRARATSYWHVP